MRWCGLCENPGSREKNDTHGSLGEDEPARGLATGRCRDEPSPAEAASVQQRRVSEAEAADHSEERGLEHECLSVRRAEQLTGLRNLTSRAVQPADHENRDARQGESSERPSAGPHEVAPSKAGNSWPKDQYERREAAQP